MLRKIIFPIIIVQQLLVQQLLEQLFIQLNVNILQG